MDIMDLNAVPNTVLHGLEVCQRSRPWVSQSSAGAAVQQMARVSPSVPDALASLVRESEDLAAAWRDQDNGLLDALSTSEGRQEQARIDALRRKIAETEGRLKAVAARIDKEFPDYAPLADPCRPSALVGQNELIA